MNLVHGITPLALNDSWNGSNRSKCI